jgi:hypothetical protein
MQKWLGLRNRERIQWHVWCTFQVHNPAAISLVVQNTPQEASLLAISIGDWVKGNPLNHFLKGTTSGGLRFVGVQDLDQVNPLRMMLPHFLVCTTESKGLTVTWRSKLLLPNKRCARGDGLTLDLEKTYRAPRSVRSGCLFAL